VNGGESYERGRRGKESLYEVVIAVAENSLLQEIAGKKGKRKKKERGKKKIGFRKATSTRHTGGGGGKGLGEALEGEGSQRHLKQSFLSYRTVASRGERGGGRKKKRLVSIRRKGKKGRETRRAGLLESWHWSWKKGKKRKEEWALNLEKKNRPTRTVPLPLHLIRG